MADQPKHERREPSAMAYKQMPGRILVGIFDGCGEAEAAIGDLKRGGFTHEDISLIMQQPEHSEDPIGTGKTKTDQGDLEGAPREYPSKPPRKSIPCLCTGQ
jgi:hypothetical protein